jgi:hypothetical protein
VRRASVDIGLQVILKSIEKRREKGEGGGGLQSFLITKRKEKNTGSGSQKK